MKYVYQKTLAQTKQENTFEPKLTRYYYNEKHYTKYEEMSKKDIDVYEYDCIEVYGGKGDYEEMVDFLVKLKYSASEENALLRKKLANLDKENEFDTYSTYVEDCKTLAKTLLN